MSLEDQIYQARNDCRTARLGCDMANVIMLTKRVDDLLDRMLERDRPR